MIDGLKEADECGHEAEQSMDRSRHYADDHSPDRSIACDIGAALWTIAGHLDRIAKELEGDTSTVVLRQIVDKLKVIKS